MGGTLDSVAGSRVTSAFMSLSSSSSWFNTGTATEETRLDFSATWEGFDGTFYSLALALVYAGMKKQTNKKKQQGRERWWRGVSSMLFFRQKDINMDRLARERVRTYLELPLNTLLAYLPGFY